MSAWLFTVAVPSQNSKLFRPLMIEGRVKRVKRVKKVKLMEV